MKVEVWRADLQTGDRTRVSADAMGVRAMAISPDHRFFYYGSSDDSKPWSETEVERLQATLARESEVDAKYVIRRLKGIVDYCMGQEDQQIEDAEVGRDGRFDAAGAHKALESLARILGLFVDRAKVQQEITHRPVNIRDMTPQEQRRRVQQLIRDHELVYGRDWDP